MPDDPCHLHQVSADDGTRLEGCGHGGHLTGWWPGGAHESRLWMSPASTCGPGLAIRGGIPVVFPQFGSLGPLRKHGFARDRAWERLDATSVGDAVLAFGTTIGQQPGWPHRAGLTLSARASGDVLTVDLRVINSGETSFAFTAALHTYLSVSGTADACVDGLAGRQAQDARAGGRRVTLPDGPLSAVGPVDLMIADAPGPVTLHDPQQHDLAVRAQGCRDWVVWNPGPGHGLADVRDGDESRFVCVEPAVLSPVRLAAGHEWSATLTLAHLPT